MSLLNGCFILLPLPVYLDVAELHSTAVRCCEGSSELDLLRQLTPLPTIWFSTLNLKGRHHHEHGGVCNAEN